MTDIQVTYVRQVDRGPDEAPAWQYVTRAVDPKALFGDDNVLEVRAIWVRYPWDREHPSEFTARPALWQDHPAWVP